MESPRAGVLPQPLGCWQIWRCCKDLAEKASVQCLFGEFLRALP